MESKKADEVGHLRFSQHVVSEQGSQTIDHSQVSYLVEVEQENHGSTVHSYALRPAVLELGVAGHLEGIRR